jgi:hypothetical protein
VVRYDGAVRQRREGHAVETWLARVESEGVKEVLERFFG